MSLRVIVLGDLVFERVGRTSSSSLSLGSVFGIVRRL